VHVSRRSSDQPPSDWSAGDQSPSNPFAGKRRKIAPFVLPESPGVGAPGEAFVAYAAEKAASLNRHVIGYGELAETEWAGRGLDAPDMDRARRYRLARIRGELTRRDLAGIIVYDPLNVRYATDATNMQLWCTHNAVRYAFVATQGPVILWEFRDCEHLSYQMTRSMRYGPARRGPTTRRAGTPATGPGCGQQRSLTWCGPTVAATVAWR